MELIAAGDADFTARKFPTAAERYRSATRVSPELAEPHFRQGFALVAQGSYAAAVRAFRRGLELRIHQTDGSFSLEDVCGAGLLAETNDRLEKAIARSPLDPDLLMCMGMQLLYDEQHDRAEVYLTQAAELGAMDGEDVAQLLPQRPVAPQKAAGKLITKVGF